MSRWIFMCLYFAFFGGVPLFLAAAQDVETNIGVSRNGPMTSMGKGMGPPPGPEGEHRGHPPGAEAERHGPPPGAGMAHGGEHRPRPPPGGSGGGGRGGPPPGLMMGGASAGMSQHKSEGLFPANDKCGTNVPGLYAAGDSLGSMQSGGIYTQIGSSLVGSAAQGALAGTTAAEYTRGVALAKVAEADLKSINADMYAPYLRQRGFSPRWVTQTLQGVMVPNFILYVKSKKRLLAALTYVEYLREHQVPLLKADDLHELRLCHETANMVLNAEMKLRASLMRTESRSSHYREDYPERNDADWLCWIKIRQAENGSMELVRHPVPT